MLFRVVSEIADVETIAAREGYPRKSSITKGLRRQALAEDERNCDN